MVFTLSADLLQFLVLSIIEKEDAYGYQISQRLRPVSNAKDSTLYPVLKRLCEEELVTVYDRQIQGRNRRYYRITEKGTKQYRQRKEEWEAWKIQMDQILEGGTEI